MADLKNYRSKINLPEEKNIFLTGVIFVAILLILISASWIAENRADQLDPAGNAARFVGFLVEKAMMLWQ